MRKIRNELIQKAQDFIKLNQYRDEDGLLTLKDSDGISGDWHVTSVSFVVKPYNRSVTLLIFGDCGKVLDAYNVKCPLKSKYARSVDLLKAITLGRALGKDVSEFEIALKKG